MRILQIVPSIDSRKGGREKHVFELVRELANMGHNVTVITLDPNFTSCDIAFNLHTTSTISVPGMPAIPSLKDLLRLMNQRFDLCHIHYHALFGEVALVASMIRRIPVVVTFHAEIKRGFHKSIYDKLTLRFIFKFCRKIICLSDSLKKGLIRRGLDPKKIVVISHFVNISKVNPNSMKIRNSLQSDILFVGRLEKRKGVQELLQTLSHLSKIGVKFNAYIVGKGPLEEQVKSETSVHPLRNHVKYLGYVKETVLRRLYNETKIVLVPSRYEGLPSVCLEAMCYGKVVIGFDIPGLRDVLVDLDQSLVVKPFDIEEMANKIIDFLSNPKRRLCIGKKARDKVKKYDVYAVLEKICNLYSELSMPKNG